MTTTFSPSGHSSGALAAKRFDRLLKEIDAVIDGDESADRRISGGWKTFDDINAAAHAHVWDAYSIDLSVDAASYRRLAPREQAALKRVFGTIYRAESVVDDWMDRIVAAIPASSRDAEVVDGMGYDAMRTALRSQEHDERMHRGSLVRVATEVLRIPPNKVDHVAQRHNNFVAETLFAMFREYMEHLLRPGRSLEDVYTAIFIYGILSEDVVANSDVVIRRTKGGAIYDEFNLPGMKEGQTNVRRDEGRHVRIAVLATHRFLDEYDSAEATLLATCTTYMDVADTLLRQAKASHGLIDAHLRESYGPDVDSLYYYAMNMKRLAVRLDELGLRKGVADVKGRVATAVSEFTDKNGQPIIESPTALSRRLAPHLLRLASR